MGKDENGYVYTEEDLFNIALEECLSEESAYDYIDNLINEIELEKFNKLQEENEKLKSELEQLKQSQLFKEDFDEYCQCVNGQKKTIIL